MTLPLVQQKYVGFNADLHPSEIPQNVYSDAHNVRYQRLGMQGFEGHTKIFATGMLHTPYFALWVQNLNDDYWIYPGASAVGVVDSNGTHSDITPAAGAVGTYNDNWTGGQINGVPYLVNPAQDPIFWDGVPANVMTTLTGWPANTKAKTIRPYNNFLVALDITESAINYANRIKWSNSAPAGTIPNSWDETDPTKDTGEAELGGTLGKLVDCLPLYGNNIVYKDNSTFAMTFVGGLIPFQFRMIFRESGIMGRNCVAQFRGRHLVLTQDDVIVHDGQSAQSIVDKRLRKWLFDQINQQESYKSYIVPYHKRDELWICVPNGEANANGSPNMALVWNYEDNQFGVRDIQNAPFIARGIVNQSGGVTDWGSDTQAWGDDTTIWNQNQVGAASYNLVMCSGANLFQMDLGTTFDGAVIDSYLERTSIPMTDDIRELKLLKAIWPTIEASLGTVFKIRVGVQSHVDDPVFWFPEKTYTHGTDDRFHTFAKGRYLSFRISSQSGMPWVLHGLAIEVGRAGERW